MSATDSGIMDPSKTAVARPVRDSEACRAWLQEKASQCHDSLRFIVRQTRTMVLIFRHPAVPWHAKLIAGFCVGYLLSPIQVIPSVIPVIGQLDDLAVLVCGMRLLRKLTPSAVLTECEKQSQSRVLLLSLGATPRPAISQ